MQSYVRIIERMSIKGEQNQSGEPWRVGDLPSGELPEYTQAGKLHLNLNGISKVEYELPFGNSTLCGEMVYDSADNLIIYKAKTK
ncbi:hypothetical protein IPM62_03475 [Candidatus Woesebacteria bacterium]|nr:MAG: hypothetical protein IPM62_03475 [Candidatus Woesebacteria bacterium]